MNSPFKVDFARPKPRPKSWDYRAHYRELAIRTLSSVVRHRRFILKCVAAGFVFACIALPLMPRRYSAEALIYPNMFSSDQEKAVAKASVDGATMVSGEARAISSDAILRAVAIRLGNDPGVATSRSWLRTGFDWFRTAWLPETLSHSSFDRA